MLIQLDLFKDEQECLVDAKLESMQLSLDKQRKSQFAKIGTLNKRMNDLEDRLIVIERNICK